MVENVFRWKIDDSRCKNFTSVFLEGSQIYCFEQLREGHRHFQSQCYKTNRIDAFNIGYAVYFLHTLNLYLARINANKSPNGGQSNPRYRTPLPCPLVRRHKQNGSSFLAPPSHLTINNIIHCMHWDSHFQPPNWVAVSERSACVKQSTDFNKFFQNIAIKKYTMK